MERFLWWSKGYIFSWPRLEVDLSYLVDYLDQIKHLHLSQHQVQSANVRNRLVLNRLKQIHRTRLSIHQSRRVTSSHTAALLLSLAPGWSDQSAECICQRMRLAEVATVRFETGIDNLAQRYPLSKLAQILFDKLALFVSLIRWSF